MVVLFLFQVGSGVYLGTHANARPMDRFRTFQIASGIFLAAYVLGHMNSVFVFARLYLGIDSNWAFAVGAPSGLVNDAWNIRLVPHYDLGVFFVLSHLTAGARAVMLSHGVARRYADRFLIGGATAAGVVAFAIMFGMCGARLNFAIPSIRANTMCGRPRGFKNFEENFDGGSTAIMCPALSTRRHDREPRRGSRSGSKILSGLKSHWFQRDLRIVGSTDRHLSQLFHPGIHAWFIRMTS